MPNILEYLEIHSNNKKNKSRFEDKDNVMNYQSMTLSAKKIGSAISKYGFARNPIAIYLDKSVDELACFFGVIYSGNFYVPIDPELPLQRIKTIFEVLKPVGVITKEKIKSEYKDYFENYNLMYIDELKKEKLDEERLAQIRQSAIDTDPIYALFTSGSTGVPKGVVVCHRSVINYAEWIKDTFSVNSDSVLGNQTPFYFSMSVLDIYGTLVAGASLCLIPKKLFMFPIELSEYLNKKKINMIYWVPTALSMFNRFHALNTIVLPYLEKILFAGEVMPTKYINEWKRRFPHILYANLFGPTEITDIGIYYILDREYSDEEPLPIGKACKNVDAFVISADNELIQEPDQEGELIIRGSFLALGYYNDWPKTREAFIQNPLNSMYPELVYKTGDIVKYNNYNELIYVGRKDFQIKHMGNRIELGEIENSVNSLEAVESCACVLDKEKDWIILFYAGRESKEMIVKRCRENLPHYMIPNKVIKIEELPLNRNGKIDRGRLLELWKMNL
ncbi:MAG: D-alanine--poly(phosphoribitol) ligase [Lachnospiraceae bacterium]|nr:D-alanine--poly(phosphoribitol) ligase [Lachnospiraceae bacterium]